MRLIFHRIKMSLKRKLLDNKLFSHLLKTANRCLWKMKASAYRRRRDAIRRRITLKEEPVNVLFFVTSMAFWRYHELFKLMDSSDRYRPLIVPYYPPHTDVSIMHDNRDAIAKYAADNSFPFRDGYDFANNTYDSLRDLQPDIVVYSQPYDWGYKQWGIDAFKKNALFIFTPYGAAVSAGRHFRDTYLTNIASWIFLGSPIEKDVFLHELPVNNESLIVVGSELYEHIVNANPASSPWPQSGRKRVIWAPHHSIDDHNSFASSHFERLADFMLSLADKYADTIDFAFKPHPILRTRLYEKWGKEKTDEYYACWNARPNTFTVRGPYAELFAFSDAMIHDCASFVAEYLYTAKPAFYVTDSDIPGPAIGNEFGQQCFMMHYHGHTTEDIERFLTETVLGTKDSLAVARKFFRDVQLSPEDSTTTVGEKMFRALSH